MGTHAMLINLVNLSNILNRMRLQFRKPAVVAQIWLTISVSELDESMPHSFSGTYSSLIEKLNGQLLFLSLMNSANHKSIRFELVLSSNAFSQALLFNQLLMNFQIPTAE